MTRAALIASLWLVSSSCTRTEQAAPTPPTTAGPATPAGAGAADLTPVKLASYVPGSSCNLVHDGEALYWLIQSMAEETGKTARADSTGACGWALDCPRTRGSVMRVAVGGGPEEVVARTSEWPWELSADATTLSWIGYCSSALWTVEKSGGTPRKLGPEGLQILDHALEPGRVLVADRSSATKGIHAIDRATGAAQVVAGRGVEASLIGTLGQRVVWAQVGDANATVYASARPDERVPLGEIRGRPMHVVPVDGGLLVQTTAAIVRISEAGAPVELTALSDYGDRGSLATAAGQVYWAGGRAGTLGRLDRDGVRREAQVGGEPCGVAVDAEHVYWLDRGRKAVMRAPLRVFE
ncbi:hypothetical protein [Nannocystis punicea]|uniref:Uncharacterized protein n=1 Tax=Nannocystis punicea TaxID=2995304 RepID=A0ABY7HCG7_9BACT|nr:hypothetical protein [Nannocystis poenicansa]WAS96983.1 hypothetical protein O0S08_12610 [Nannocystis poenicansa]